MQNEKPNPATVGLLEREGEFAQLGELVAAARDADGAIAVVEGPPGIGKTRLLSALRGLAVDDGLEVLRARGGEREQGFAFGVARQLFEAPVASAPEEQRTELLSGAAALAAPLVDPSEAPDQPAQPADPFPLVHGLYWLCANLADRTPLALLIDDAHWADLSSLRFLHYLSRRLEGVPALLALACRSTSPEAPVEPIEAIKLEEACAVVRPRALSEPAAAELLTVRLEAEPASELTREAHRVTRGNPFLLSELGRSLAAEGVVPDAAAAAQIRRASPEMISRSALTRLARLPSAARDLARTAALLGEDAEPRHAAALAALGEEEALAAADHLAAAGFLDAEARLGTAPKLQFAHPLIRQALYADLPEGERARCHKQAARLIATEPGSPERVAAHLLEATPAADPWVVEALSEAAAAAMATGSPEIAAAYMRRALAEPPAPSERAKVLFRLGEVEALLEEPAALEHLTESFELARDPTARATIAAVLVNALNFAGRLDQALEVVERAAEGLSAVDADLRQGLEARILSSARVEPSLSELREGLAERLRSEGFEGEGLGAKCLMAGLAMVEALACVPTAEAVTLSERALEGGVLVAGDNGGPDYGSAVLLLALADSELALVTVEAGLEAAHRRGDVFALAANKLLGCLAHLVRGELVDAVAAGEDGLAANDAHGRLAVLQSWGAGFLAAAHIERGDLDEAERTLARASTDAEVPNNMHWHWFLSSRCLLRIVRGDLRTGLEAALECGRRFEAIGGRNPAFMPWRSRAAICLSGLGEEPERARAFAAEEVELARVWGAPRALGAGLRAQGVVLGGEKGLELLREAIGVLEGSPARLEYARALCELGAALRRANRRSEAREPLEAAIELARACGAASLAERAHSELRATGARPRSLFFSGVESLTARERQAAELAAEGRSNPEIAQELFITRKTVESHLGAAYGKLQIESREQLAEALAPASRQGVVRFSGT